jgi:hypothetical protein
MTPKWDEAYGTKIIPDAAGESVIKKQVVNILTIIPT